MNTLKNEFIEIEVADHGAELQSLRKNGKEYLWQGDARYWGRRSPVLFPMVGRVWGDVYRHNGREFELGQHGFARDMDFTLISCTDSSLTYRLKSNESTLQLYPFDFTLDITYRIDGSTLEVSWSVTNDSTEVMPFQIGAHPAFMIPDFDAEAATRAWFDFDSTAPLTYISPAEKGCVSLQPHTLHHGNGNPMPIELHTFDCDTYIFQNSQLKRVSLLYRDKSPYLTVGFTAPLVALWSPTATKPDCPFVCIEPWYGRCDEVGYNGEFADRDVMNHLAPGDVFKASYTITIDE